MFKYTVFLILSLSLLAAGSVQANEPQASENFIFHYANGDTYAVTITDSTFTWEALTGENAGEKETDAMQTRYLKNGVQVIQWREKSGIFVTVILDRKQLEVISSGLLADASTWIANGWIEKTK